VNRRGFLRQVGGASAGLACGALGLGATGCIGFHYVTATPARDGVVVRKRDLGDLRFALVEAPDGRHPIYLYRMDGGGFSAVSTRCTHRGCPVEPVAGHLVCPCHGSEYTNTGDVVHGPAEHPLTRFAVRETDDALVIDWRDDGRTA
jgi:cytochrome b6-f complex iron-sulfur subunit